MKLSDLQRRADARTVSMWVVRMAESANYSAV